MNKFTKNLFSNKRAAMKRNVIITFLFSFFLFQMNAQVFWTETFSNGCTANCNANAYTGPNGAWTVATVSTEGANANRWFVSCAEDGNAIGMCGTGCSSSDPS
ncbi:MAG: hypothetical protein H0X46_08560, partial [Bacteroidetes bacterium]|nr:hypothetical protein [Bacteroidota bacterium]